MGELRIELIEERIERLCERTELLQDEFDGVRRRTRRLHEQTPDDTGSQVHAADRPVSPGRGRTVRPDRGRASTTSGASDEEVAAAVRRIETDDEATDRHLEEIIVA